MSELSPEFIELLACPETGEPLKISDNQLVSVKSNIHYPIISDVPWLNRNPLHSMVDWSVKLGHFQQILSTEIRELGNQLKNANAFARPRLEKLLNAKQAFLNQVTQLVAPILSAKVASKPVYDAMSDRAPSTQNLLSYEANLYRDWVWGDLENEKSLEIVSHALGNDKIDNLLVLGAGSCRLAYDLHQHYQPRQTIANDINPMLLFAAKQILKENGLGIFEFPAFPINTDAVAVEHQIKSVESNTKGLNFLFSDALTPSIQKGKINAVVTPWLIDIQPHELGKFIAALNHYLPIGGIWANFGSLVFAQDRSAFCYTTDEISQILIDNGFELENQTQTQIPYLKSPYNAGHRIETVFSWRAKKVKDCPTPKVKESYPDWIIDTNKPVATTKTLKGQAFSYQMYSEILHLADGKRSLNQIAKKIARDYKIDEKESLAMTKQFFLKLC